MSESELNLPAGCLLRQASEGDRWTIRKLVLSAKLDPTQLRWQQFWVIECQGKVVACGQLRNFRDAQELGSLVVAKDWRNRGLGTYLVNHLIQEATQPLYLECLGKQLENYYTRFDFVPVAWPELPPSLQLKFGISHLAKRFLRVPVTIMQYVDNSTLRTG